MYVYVDFDGVLADTALVKKRWIASVVNRQVEATYDRSTLLPLIGEDVYLNMQADIGYGDTLHAPPVAGAVGALKRLSGVASIIVVSARPPRKMIWLDRWLDRYGLKQVVMETVSACSCPKSDVVRKYGAGWLIDDDARHASGLPIDVTFILFGPREEIAQMGAVVARDWACVETLIFAGSREAVSRGPRT